MAISLNWALLIATVIIMIALALYSNRIVHSSKGEGGFLLAANSLGPFIGGATIVATGFSGWGFMGSPGVAYKYGAIELLGNFFFAPAMIFAVLFCARFLHTKANKIGSLTLPEYIANSHEGPDTAKRLTQAFVAVITIVLLLVFLVGQIKALGLLAGPWLGVDNHAASLLMLAIIVVYTSIGGLAAVALTDAFMVVGMCISALVIIWTIFSDLPIAELLASLDAIDPELLAPSNSGPYGASAWHVLLVLPYAFIYSTTLPYMSVRFMALSSKTKLHHIAAYMTPMACLLSLVPIAGLYVRVKVPGLENPDQAMPTFLTTFLSPTVSAVVTLFILFAMKSTTNSVLHSIAGSVSHDLRQAIWPNCKLSDRSLLYLNRFAVWILGAAGFTLMLYVPPFMLSMLAILGSGTLMAALVAPTLLAHFIPANIYAALVSIVIGFMTGCTFFLYFDLGWVEAPIYASMLACISYYVTAKAFQNRHNHVEHNIVSR
ncbi:sodium:solute symporter family protein [Photobacterium sp. ZSDE20]|uniref:Sodium:solute symporter family protein n=1 Tax=Photobacterium pectinilyticum TaxID=2906793 RepID=A0ABT1N0D9_9GAMM|nr:sodium:solute symporter family protein [Photobacterium sp. ZSDE20]MCQ1058180.1 sodium:solute symporter family protein [Photobacterium sp. ZSDE20]MDD1822904.1 sodium:solute symporter family protein [Photobacterium sp. ZSDE20]